MKRNHLRFFILRWHKRAGVVLALFLSMMAVSGVLLNHAHDWRLDRQALDSRFWQDWYGVGAPLQLPVGGKMLVLADSRLLINDQVLGDCPRFLGLVRLPQLRVAACPRLLVLLTDQGDVIDRQGEEQGLSTILQAIGMAEGHVVVQGPAGVLLLNTDDFSLSTEPQATPVSWEKPLVPPQTISRERWLQDLHSGRLWGARGVLVTDALALLLLLLATSGWFLARKRHRPL